MIGWRRWWDKKVTNQVVGLVADRFQPPQRKDLGDLDQDKWERDNSGNEKDPWQFGFFLRLVDPENDDAYAWAATSFGAKKAIGNLLGALAKQHKKDPTCCVPVVRLASDFYKHKDYGRVDTPKFEIVEWCASEMTPKLPAPDGSDESEMDDDIPF
jgi:hypothetical protein